jgi:hypothetical protein
MVAVWVEADLIVADEFRDGERSGSNVATRLRKSGGSLLLWM